MPKKLQSSTDLKELQTEEAEREEKLMQDVLLLLKNLIYREEITVKLILNCLYDAGSTNLINQKFQSRTLNKTLKGISKLSKPAFRLIAWQWFKSNCPKLIANWLRSKIEFKIVENEKVENAKVEIVADNEDSNLISLQNHQYQVYEVQQLQSQVKLLASLLVGTVTILGGSFIWAGYSLERSHLQVVEQLQTQVKTLEASVKKQ
ncbi:hypothetical protein VB713_19220 [Anabaena cylindrica UHCC 0172]|uniref:hypothetical protein n=1 Tax=Anabaena cylindrica TaxID=1165 RepID=UPI002B21C4B0|nr:hypothetical protein [Anabaena cylindrica]MEA5553079.1 hypothetical protein [Anabaena cylindrica UHCC 0172]